MTSTRAFVLGLTAVVAACAGDPFAGETDPDLVTGSWVLERLVTEEGRSEPAAVAVRMIVDLEGLRGVAGPNDFGGAYRAEVDGAFMVTDLVSTDVGGPGAVEGQRYLLAFGQATRYEVDTRELRVYTASGATLIFRREVAEPTGD